MSKDGARFSAMELRLLRAEARRVLFKQVFGRAAISDDEVGGWAAKQEALLDLDPSDILTEKQIAETLKGKQHG